MGRIRTALGAALLCVAGGIAPAMAAAGSAGGDSFSGTRDFTDEAREFVGWVERVADNAGLPFAVVDKKAARIHVFDRQGRLAGSSPALLGQAIGDESAPEVGEHAQTGSVPFEERTTPAGRFVSKPGLNSNGEPVVWVDYEAAFAIHRLRPGPSRLPREVRLASLAAADHRVSYGCVVVPEAFYKGVVQRVLGHGSAVVYVLPEKRAVQEIFGTL
jgi:hypothetical protein